MLRVIWFALVHYFSCPLCRPYPWLVPSDIYWDLVAYRRGRKAPAVH